jgi:hypothetical protein
MSVLAHHKSGWSISYKTLKRGAQILFDESKKYKNLFGEDLCMVSTLLLAFAVECLIKGYLSTKEVFVNNDGTLKSKFKTHKLCRMAAYAKLDLSEDDLKILEFLTHCLEWKGRYPVPSKYEAIENFMDLYPINIHETTERAFTVCDNIEIKLGSPV